MKKSKVWTSFLVFIFSLLFIPISAIADNGLKLYANTNIEEVRAGQEIVVTISVKDFQDSHKGTNVLKATLDYDTRIFETIDKTDFQLLNSWEELIYNPDNQQFVVIKKAGLKAAEDVAQLRLKAKSDIAAGTTLISVKDVVTSSGKKDVESEDITVDMEVIYEQTMEDVDEIIDENVNEVIDGNINEITDKDGNEITDQDGEKLTTEESDKISNNNNNNSEDSTGSKDKDTNPQKDNGESGYLNKVPNYGIKCTQ